MIKRIGTHLYHSDDLARRVFNRHTQHRRVFETSVVVHRLVETGIVVSVGNVDRLKMSTIRDKV